MTDAQRIAQLTEALNGMLEFFATYESDYDEVLCPFENARTAIDEAGKPNDAITKHLADKGRKCPECGDTHLEFQTPTFEGADKLFVGQLCYACGATWYDDFVLAGFSALRKG